LIVFPIGCGVTLNIEVCCFIAEKINRNGNGWENRRAVVEKEMKMKKAMFIMIIAMFIFACAGVVGTPPTIGRTHGVGLDNNGTH